MDFNEISEIINQLNIPNFRAKQIFQWLQKGINSFDQMSNVPKDIINKLKQNFFISYCDIEEKHISKIDGTVKYLFKLYDGELIESVIMKYKHGFTICISTQAGCLMGCKFCASTIDGKRRNLTAGEMLSQIFEVEKDLGIKISNIVLMGMGEPLDNYDNTIKFLKLVSSKDGLNIGMRHITLSTCGIVDKIKQLEKLSLQITLSISLHAPNDEIRNQIMPINKRFGVTQLINACKDYFKATNRRISFEYALIDNLNDTKECALELAQLLKGMLCHVNLIPANPVYKDKFKKSQEKNVIEFAQILKIKGINVTIRRTLGTDINASCGQLRAKKKQL